jgi:hypothetical protein
MRTFFTVILLLYFSTWLSAFASELPLEQTHIKEGSFSILMHKPQRTERSLRDESRGITITTYSYQSYIPSFDISYTAGFTDWTVSKNYEIKEYGYPLSSVAGDLDTSVHGVKIMTEKGLRVPVHLLASQEITYKTHPGRDAKFEFVASGLRYIIRYRTYMIGHKEYWHQVVYPFRYQRYASPQAFLDSFKVEQI